MINLGRGALAFAVFFMVLLAGGPAVEAALPPQSPRAADSITYTVARGDTLSSIAARFGSTVPAIQQANRLQGTSIYVGQRLVIPAAPSPGVVLTDVQLVMANQNVNIRTGPGHDYAILGQLFAGQSARVTGMSVDQGWWRVVCPDGSTGSCWVSARAPFTQPVSGSGQGDQIPVLETNVQYARAQTDVNVRSGPGTSFPVVSRLYAGQVARVLGTSQNWDWYRIVCPDGSAAACWVSAKPHLTRPTSNTR
jgi:uncharacterized protein YgiM (DUF1202 family)